MMCIHMCMHPTGNFLRILCQNALVQDQGILPASVGGGWPLMFYNEVARDSCSAL